MIKKIPLPIYLLPAKHQALKDLSASKGVTMTALINNLIDKELRKAK